VQPFPPQPPDLPAETVAALLAHADAWVEWLHDDRRRAAEHGHRPPAEDAQLSGYEFMALWLREAYLD
jgi:hypothetical protein